MGNPVKRKKSPKRHYDVEMIHDFLEHLRWEYATVHFENMHPGGRNAELQEQLAKYMKKYDSVLMYAIVSETKKSVSDEVVARYREKRARQCEAVLKALDMLKPALGEALTCASRPHTFPTISFDVWRKQIEDTEGREDQPEEL